MNLLNRYSTLFILLFRFVYGIRILSPLVIGIAEIPPRKYMILNFIAALLWTIVSCALGYYLGDFLFGTLHKIDPLLKYALIMAAIALILEIIHRVSAITLKDKASSSK